MSKKAMSLQSLNLRRRKKKTKETDLNIKTRVGLCYPRLLSSRFKK